MNKKELYSKKLCELPKRKTEMKREKAGVPAFWPLVPAATAATRVACAARGTLSEFGWVLVEGGFAALGAEEIGFVHIVGF
jgi:hypothetical protein